MHAKCKEKQTDIHVLLEVKKVFHASIEFIANQD